jgi:hypothetical protein
MMKIGAEMNLEVRNELADEFGGVRTLIELAPELSPKVIFEKLGAKVRHIVGLAKEARDDFDAFLRLPDDDHTDADLSTGLVALGFIAARLENLTGFFDTAPTFSGPLSVEIGELTELADDFRDLEETFALSLSPAFNEEIKKAREEALRS